MKDASPFYPSAFTFYPLPFILIGDSVFIGPNPES
jgi:hypothetical protein